MEQFGTNEKYTKTSVYKRRRENGWNLNVKLFVVLWRDVSSHLDHLLHSR